METLSSMIAPETAVQVPPEVEQLRQEAPNWPATAEAFTITTEAEHAEAGERLKLCKARQALAEAKLRPIIDHWLAGHRMTLALLREATEPYAQAERLYKAAILAYQVEQKRLEQEKADAENERRRREGEEAQEAAAQRMEAAGASPREVAAFLSRPIVTPPVIVPKSPTIPGISKPRDNWKGHVENLHHLIVYVAKNPKHTYLLSANQSQINNLARAMREQLDTIPGLRAYNDQNLAVRKA